jgi:hypothetical protein
MATSASLSAKCVEFALRNSHAYSICYQARGAAKTEIEKLKLSELTARQAVFEVARMYVSSHNAAHKIQKKKRGSPLVPRANPELSIHLVHDEIKDKDFELEMSWICPESNNQHQVHLIFLRLPLSLSLSLSLVCLICAAGSQRASSGSREGSKSCY